MMRNVCTGQRYVQEGQLRLVKPRKREYLSARRVWKPRWQTQSGSVASKVVPQSSSSGGLKPSSRLRPAHTMLGPCFECGNLGHLKQSCPEMMFKKFNEKIRIFRPIEAILSGDDVKKFNEK